MTEIPAGAPTPQDRKKKKSPAARRAEADGFALIELTCGVTVRLPLGGKMPIALIELLDEHELVGPPANDHEERRREFALTKALLGPDDWAAFRAVNPTVDDYTELAEKIAAQRGN